MTSVHWQVTGIRNDVWAQEGEETRPPVEEEKPSEERGFFLRPDVHGEPEERGIEQTLRTKREQQIEELNRGIEEHRQRFEALRDKFRRRNNNQ